MAETVKIDNDSLKNFNYVKDDDLVAFFTSDKDVAVVVNRINDKVFEIKENGPKPFNGVIYKNENEIAPKIPENSKTQNTGIFDNFFSLKK